MGKHSGGGPAGAVTPLRTEGQGRHNFAQRKMFTRIPQPVKSIGILLAEILVGRCDCVASVSALNIAVWDVDPVSQKERCL